MLVIGGNVVSLQIMNILIEDAETLEFFTGDNKWSKKASEGKNFGATEAAFNAAKKEPIGKFNIVFYISQTKQLINMDHGKGRGSVETGSIMETAAPVNA